MEAVFLKLLTVSINVSWLVFAVMILRILFRRAPKSIRCMLWAFVAIRLIFPFSPESEWSLIPDMEFMLSGILQTETTPPETFHSGTVQTEANVIETNVMETNAVETTRSETARTEPVLPDSWDVPLLNVPLLNNTFRVLLSAASILWLPGFFLFLVYALISFLLIRKRTEEAVYLKSRIWICDRIPSAFILGMIRPRIYLPSSIDEEDIPYVILHENAHLKRLDHIWKPLAFLLLSVYWFNPVMWIACILFCRDMELACDEKVIRESGSKIKKPYSLALINCSAPRRRIAPCPLSFGETGVKTRIREILSYKKPSLRLTLAALIVSFTVSGCLLADPKTETAAVNGSLNTDAQSGAADDVFLPSDYFNTWFSSNETGRTDFANSCLSSFYDSPQDIDLNKFFYNGFSAEIEDADISFLENQGADLSMDIIKLPRTDMDRILTQYFGITLAETSRKGMENFYYNPETDTYYTLHNDCFYEYINIQEQHPGENGTITIIYTTKSLPDSTGENEKRTAVLKKTGDQYQFLSNRIYTVENHPGN